MTKKQKYILFIGCISFFIVGYVFCKISTKEIIKIKIKKERIFQDVNVKNILISNYSKNLQLFNKNLNEIQNELKSLLNYMKDFHQLIQPITDNIGAIKTGKFVSSFFIPAAIDEVLTSIMDGVDFINEIDKEISTYIQATEKSKIKKLIDEMNEFKKDPNNLILAQQLQNDILNYTFYMFNLKNSLSKITEILNTLYESYTTINEKAKFLLEKIGINSEKDLMGLQEDIKKIQSVVYKNEKLIDENIKIINEIKGIITGYSQIIMYEKKEKYKNRK
jgi:hypothetical protein